LDPYFSHHAVKHSNLGENPLPPGQIGRNVFSVRFRSARITISFGPVRFGNLVCFPVTPLGGAIRKFLFPISLPSTLLPMVFRHLFSCPPLCRKALWHSVFPKEWKYRTGTFSSFPGL
jgi:hypothetical protein